MALKSIESGQTGIFIPKDVRILLRDKNMTILKAIKRGLLDQEPKLDFSDPNMLPEEVLEHPLWKAKIAKIVELKLRLNVLEEKINRLEERSKLNGTDQICSKNV